MCEALRSGLQGTGVGGLSSLVEASWRGGQVKPSNGVSNSSKSALCHSETSFSAEPSLKVSMLS